MSKESEAALRELAEKYAIVLDLKHGWIKDEVTYNEILSDITAHINEHYYPKEFVEWAIYLATDEDGTYSTFISVKASNEPYAHTEEVVFNSVEEAFKWWKENER